MQMSSKFNTKTLENEIFVRIIQKETKMRIGEELDRYT
jgi:hypothetical protein